MPYYTDPSTLASFWVNPGEDIETARARNAALTQQAGGDPNAIMDPIGNLPPGDFGRVPPGTQGKAPLPMPAMPVGGGIQQDIRQTAPAATGPFTAPNPERFGPGQPFDSPAPAAPNVSPAFEGLFHPQAGQTPTGQPAAPAPAPSPYMGNVGGPSAPLPPYQPPTIGGSPTEQYGTLETLDEMGNQVGPTAIPQINLGAPPEVSAYLPEAFREQFINQMGNIAQSASGQFDYQLPTARAASMNEAGVPQPGAASFNISPEISRFLGGQGLDPATMAALRARAIEDTSSGGRLELGQAKRALGQAGLSQSPAGAAVQQDVARRTAQQQTGALRDIDVQNAMLGMENQRLGVGYQTQIGLSNMEAANQMALANANRLFSAMSQNLANQQQANQAQFGAETNRLGERARTGADVLSQQGNILQNTAANRANQADFFNAGNWMNQGLNQAQLDRQRALANQQAQENRWQTGTSIMAGFAPNPAAYGGGGQSFSPIAAPLIGVGNELINYGLNQPNQQQPRRTG